MDARARNTDFLDTYVQAQQRLLDSWMSIAQAFQVRVDNAEDRHRLQQITEQPLQVWQDQAQRFVDSQFQVFFNTQAIFTQYWLDVFSSYRYLPVLTENWVRYTQQLMERSEEQLEDDAPRVEGDTKRTAAAARKLMDEKGEKPAAGKGHKTG